MTTSLLVTIVYVAADYRRLFPVQDLSLAGACRFHAQSVINAVQEETYYRAVVNYLPTNNANRSASSFGGTVAASRAVNAAADWWSMPATNYAISANGTPVSGPVLQNFQLIEGSMRTLATIYNNNAGIRCALGAYVPLTNLPLPQELINAGAVTTIAIRGFNTDTNADLCPAALNPAPVEKDPVTNPGPAPSSAFLPGSGTYTEPPGSYVGAAPAPGSGALGALPANAQIASRGIQQTNVGFELKVQVAYTQNGVAKSCNYTQKFQYPRDATAPRPPTLNVTTVAFNDTVGANCRNPSTAPIITIGYQDPNELERGAQFICHDLSWKRNWAANAGPNFGPPPCVFGGAFNGWHEEADDPAAQDFTSRQGSWVACDQLTQCGFPPTAVAYNQGNPNVANGVGAAGAHILTLNYPAMPFGCVMNFEVVAVDTAGNTSVAGQAANRVSLGVGANDEIKYPTCGVLCNLPGYTSWGPFNFPNGYYTCRAAGVCCVDPPGFSNCTPFN